MVSIGVGAAAALCSGCGVPVVESERGRDGEDQWESEEVVVLSVWEGGDRRGELHGELLRGGGHGVVAPLRVQGEVVVQPGSFMGRGRRLLGCVRGGVGQGVSRRARLRGHGGRRRRGRATGRRGARPWARREE